MDENPQTLQVTSSQQLGDEALQNVLLNTYYYTVATLLENSCGLEELVQNENGKQQVVFDIVC